MLTLEPIVSRKVAKQKVNQRGLSTEDRIVVAGMERSGMVST